MTLGETPSTGEHTKWKPKSLQYWDTKIVEIGYSNARIAYAHAIDPEATDPWKTWRNTLQGRVIRDAVLPLIPSLDAASWDLPHRSTPTTPIDEYFFKNLSSYQDKAKTILKEGITTNVEKGKMYPTGSDMRQTYDDLEELLQARDNPLTTKDSLTGAGDTLFFVTSGLVSSLVTHSPVRVNDSHGYRFPTRAELAVKVSESIKSFVIPQRGVHFDETTVINKEALAFLDLNPISYRRDKTELKGDRLYLTSDISDSIYKYRQEHPTQSATTGCPAAITEIIEGYVKIVARAIGEGRI